MLVCSLSLEEIWATTEDKDCTTKSKLTEIWIEMMGVSLKIVLSTIVEQRSYDDYEIAVISENSLIGSWETVRLVVEKQCGSFESFWSAVVKRIRDKRKTEKMTQLVREKIVVEHKKWRKNNSQSTMKNEMREKRKDGQMMKSNSIIHFYTPSNICAMLPRSRSWSRDAPEPAKPPLPLSRDPPDLLGQWPRVT